MSYVPLRKAVAALGLHPNTLRRFADENQIKTIRTAGNMRLYDIDSYLRNSEEAKTICYCRVSSHKQSDDLFRQVEKLQELYKEAEIIKDIGSGLNFKRKGLQTILERILCGDKLKIVVTHKDRLVRFGFDIIDFLVRKNNGEIVVLDPYVATSKEAELTADLLAILHYFSCKMHGSRSGKGKKDKIISHSGAGKDIAELASKLTVHLQQNGGNAKTTKRVEISELDESKTPSRD